jgi:hypothetical protein
VDDDIRIRFEFQTKMLEKGAEELQRQIARLDEILFKIKASAITVWTALMGWSLTNKAFSLSLLGFVLIAGFWIFEVVYRGLQIGYIGRAKELSTFFNDDTRLAESLKAKKFPPNLVYPLTFRQFSSSKERIYAKAFLSPAVFLLYVFLALVNGGLSCWLHHPQ